MSYGFATKPIFLGMSLSRAAFGGNNNVHGRPPIANGLRQLQSIHRAWHFDIRKNGLDVIPRLKNFDGFISIGSGQNVIAFRNQIRGNGHHHPKLVFDHKNGCHVGSRFCRDAITDPYQLRARQERSVGSPVSFCSARAVAEARRAEPSAEERGFNRELSATTLGRVRALQAATC